MTLSTTSILEAMHANTYFQMEYFPKVISAWDLKKCDDVTMVHAEIADDTFNYVMRTRFTKQNLHTRIKEVMSIYDTVPFSWWVSELDTPAMLKSALIQHGLSPKEVDVGMYCTELSLPQTPPPIAIHRVKTPEQLKDYFNVYTAIGGSPEAYDRIFRHASLITYANSQQMQLYLGYVNQMPVLTGMLVLHNGAAGIYYVMTHPEHRKKGFGTAMMKHLMQTAHASGYKLATLQASAQGKSLYERLGFKAICEFEEYGYSPT